MTVDSAIPAASDAAAGDIRVAGQPLARLPDDLYIPPDALRVFLETFEGPLDLLLYLIRRQNLDILDIPVHTIAEQYMGYIELMQDMAVELAGEYLLMAAMLAEIKSRMLLPRPVAEDDEQDNPRAELIRRLQVYEQYKQAAEQLDALPRIGRDLTPITHPPARLAIAKPLPALEAQGLLRALHDVVTRAELFTRHRIQGETLSVRNHMSRVLERLDAGNDNAFNGLIDPEEGRLGVAVSFLAVLELVRETLIVMDQPQPYAPLSLRLAAARA